MTETLTTHFRVDNFHAALVANDTSVLHPLVLTADTLEVPDWPKDLSAKQAIPLRLERTVVDRFWLLHFAVRPAPNLLRRCE